MFSNVCRRTPVLSGLKNNALQRWIGSQMKYLTENSQICLFGLVLCANKVHTFKTA